MNDRRAIGIDILASFKKKLIIAYVKNKMNVKESD